MFICGGGRSKCGQGQQHKANLDGPRHLDGTDALHRGWPCAFLEKRVTVVKLLAV